MRLLSVRWRITIQIFKSLVLFEADTLAYSPFFLACPVPRHNQSPLGSSMACPLDASLCTRCRFADLYPQGKSGHPTA